MSGRIIGELVLPDNPTGKHFTDNGTWADIPAPIPGPQGDPGVNGQDGQPGRSIQVFEQAGEPVTAQAGDVWIVP